MCSSGSEGPREATGGGWMGAESKFFHKNGLCPKFKPQSQNFARRWWTHQPIEYKWYPQSYKCSRKRMESIEHPVSKIWPKPWANIELKSLAGQCLTGGLSKLKRQAGQCLGQVGQCPVGLDKVRLGVSGNMNFTQNPSISSQTWFLSYRPPN
jgi:hypothetical protein